MKKVVALILCGVMMASISLTACSKGNKEKETEEKKSQAVESVDDDVEESDTKEDEDPDAEKTETKKQKPEAHLNKETIEKLDAYFASLDPEVERNEGVYCDGIRGEGLAFWGEDSLLFAYDSMDYDSIQITIPKDTEELSITIDLDYGDTRYYGRAKTDLGGMEELIDQMVKDPASVSLDDATASFEMYDDSAVAQFKEEIQKDLPILYSRIITLGDSAFAEAGYGIEDIGVDFGDEYRSVDPEQATSKETVVDNEHVFVDGICSDCGMTWTEYYYDVVGKFMHGDFGNGQHTCRGQNSATMLSQSDYVQYSANHEAAGSMYYQHVEIDNDRGIFNDEMCNLSIDFYRSQADTSLEYTYEQGAHKEVTFEYTITFDAAPEEYEKIFASKESLMEYATVTLEITTEDSLDVIEAWETMDESEIKAMCEANNAVYYSKEEIVDRFWDNHEIFLESLDNGMVWMETSLADVGITW